MITFISDQFKTSTSCYKIILLLFMYLVTLNFFLFQKRFEGTCVTVESFIKWKVKFDAEMTDLKKTKTVEENEQKKLTGT